MCPRFVSTGCTAGVTLVQVRTNGGRQVEDDVARRHDHRPALPLYLTEPGRAVADYGLYLAARPLAPRLPRGDGHPVLVLPGLLADDISTRALRTVLRRLGYDAQGWGLGRNIGPTAACVTGMRDLLSHLNDRHGKPVTVIGWSLGGIFARDLARRSPDSVRQVITLGSPFRLARNSQSRATNVFERFSHLHVEHHTLPLESEAVPLTVPATSIYSHFDGIVHWRTCLDTPGERCENIAVMASHLGLGHHPAAIWAIADRLAQPEGTWKPFKAPLFLRPAFPRPAQPEPSSPLAAQDSAA
jgi:pimeloyl-ACP methyl ester carboxylesterase